MRGGPICDTLRARAATPNEVAGPVALRRTPIEQCGFVKSRCATTYYKFTSGGVPGGGLDIWGAG
ncbi:mannosyltransferase [Mycobacterium heckeshornense]|uniref:hypothetical protein n=1 Tax=Mycobacterium heckeshornense TaxID=110505 RepID=UPI001940E5E0|nr:hypothetical protein [Mycobacterium heckeshornense]BCQ09223.1 mannosyltransferase [Mycobacterium heckeshornense]